MSRWLCALACLPLILAAGCGASDDGGGSDAALDSSLDAPEVVDGKAGTRVVNEVDRPDASRRGYALETGAEPPEPPEPETLMAALEEELDGRKGYVSQAQADVSAAYQFSIEYGEALLRSPGSGTSWVYRYAVPPAECISIDGQTARCTIYVYTEELGTGHGGVDRWVRREHLLALRIGDNLYDTSINFVDFTGGQPICSDGNIQGIPLCSPNGPS